MAIKASSMSGVPKGSTADRPSNPSIGDQFANGSIGVIEIYTESGWVPATGANDFNISITGDITSTVLNKQYFAGAYSINSSSGDTSYDIYLVDDSGNSAGYTKTGGVTATNNFNKVVVMGGTIGDVLSFSYKTTYITSLENSELKAGPFISSISSSLMANQNDTITITGGNFATDVEVAFTGTGYSSTAAKSVVRASSTSLIVTRPDNFPPSASPYTITITNPGVTSPTGTNKHISSNSITSGNTPVWVTSSPLTTFSKNSSYSVTLQATDSDSSSSVSYSIVSGSLPAGLSLNSTTGVISGTPTSSLNASVTIRATDSGGNYIDRSFSIPNAQASWTTSGTLTTALLGSAYSYQLVASDDSNSITYSINTGSLPAGLSLSSSGLISGTPSSAETSSFTVNAYDGNNYVSSGTLSLSVASPQFLINGSSVTGSVNYTYNMAGASAYSFNFNNSVWSSVKLKLYGAGGGANSYAGGSGGYVEGVFNPQNLPSKTFHVIVGGAGSNYSNGGATANGGWAVPGGYNGGGRGVSNSQNSYSVGAGGGATDARLVFNSVTDYANAQRFLVAGGGGGATNNSGAIGGSGGYPNGNNGQGGGGLPGLGGTQTAGGAYGGAFGVGGENTTNSGWNGGGGGGWYGGGAERQQHYSGGGGSSYYNSTYISSFNHSTGGGAGYNNNGSAQLIILG